MTKRKNKRFIEKLVLAGIFNCTVLPYYAATATQGIAEAEQNAGNPFADGAKVYHANQDPNNPDIILTNKEVHEFEPDCEDGDNSMNCRPELPAYYGIRAIWDKDIQKYVYVESDYDSNENTNFENANEEWYGHPETPEGIGSAFTRKLLELNMQAATSETVKKTVTQEVSSNTAITKIKTDVESKASKSDVTAVNNNLQSQINNKIDKSELNNVKNEISNNVDTKVSNAVSQATSNLQGKIDAKCFKNSRRF